jgi:hypothetical protein
MVGFPFISQRKSETTLLLDIGTETVKALLFRKNGPKINVLASSFEYFDRFGAFDTWDFEKDVMERTILRTVRKLGVLKNKSLVLGLPADILKARVLHQGWERVLPKKTVDEREEKDIYQKIIAKTRNIISRDFSQKTGILPDDIQFINFKILETKIDGYRVPIIRKYEGKNLSFKTLTTFSVGGYLEKIRNILAAVGFKAERLIHEAEGLKSYFAEKSDGTFIDMGGSITQIFLVRAGVLEEVGEFAVGGQIFSKAISEKLGLTEADARILKERYSKKELSKESLDRMDEFLWPAWQTWLENLRLKLKEMAMGYLPASEILVFGGGSHLPDIRDVFKAKGKNMVPSGAGLEIKILENGQEIPLLLMAYACLDVDNPQ